MQLADGAILPVLGTGMGAGSGSGLGIGGGVLGGAVAGALTGMLTGNRGGWGGNNWNGGGAPATTAVATDIVLNPAFQSIQHQIDSLSGQLGTNTVLEAVRHIDDQVAGYNTNTQNLIGNVATAQATSAFTTLQSINDLGRDATAQSNQNALQQVNSFNNLTTTTLQGFNGAAMQVQNVTNQIIGQLQAMAATNAACCCEIKSLIQSDGNETRALINNNTIQALRDKNVELAGEVSNFRQNQFLINSLKKSTID